MFKLQKQQEYTWPVTAQIPDDGGRWIKATFTVRFRRIPQSEVERLVDAGDDYSFLQRVVADWSGISDPEGNSIPFSDEALAEVCEMPEARAAIVRAFFDSIKGKEGRRGN